MTVPANRVQRAYHDERDMVDHLWPAGIAPKRGLIIHVQKSRIDAARNLTDDNSAQAMFPTTEDAFTVVAGQQYRFRANLQVTKGANSIALSWLFGGTATFTTCVYNAVSTAAAAGTAAAANMIDAVAATAVAIQAATTAVNVRAIIEGEFEINAAGTIIPQLQFGGATGATPVVKVGSFFEMWPEGLNPVTGIGNVA